MRQSSRQDELIARLWAEIDGLRADHARLEWLSCHGRRSVLVRPKRIRGIWDFPSRTVTTLRELIDAAMQREDVDP